MILLKIFLCVSAFVIGLFLAFFGAFCVWFFLTYNYNGDGRK